MARLQLQLSLTDSSAVSLQHAAQANQGVIVLSEVQATLQDVGTPDTLVARMAELDKDGNGYVIFPEFLMAFCDWVGVDEEEDE